MAFLYSSTMYLFFSIVTFRHILYHILSKCYLKMTAINLEFLNLSGSLSLCSKLLVTFLSFNFHTILTISLFVLLLLYFLLVISATTSACCKYSGRASTFFKYFLSFPTYTKLIAVLFPLELYVIFIFLKPSIRYS